MTYGSSDWHKRVGRANIEAEINMAAAEDNYQRDLEAVEKFEEGESVEATTKNGETVRGFILEILESEAKITVENWDHCVTVEARHVKYY